MSEEDEGAITRDIRSIDIEDEVQDWKLLNATSIPKRGEKDEVPDGTSVQLDSLNESKSAMYTALEHVRGHHLKSLLVCCWVPWEKRSIVLHAKGNYFRDMGTPIGCNSISLTPLETLYLVERGSMVAYLMEEEYKSQFAEDFGSFDYTRLEPLDLAYLYGLCFDNTGYSVDQYQIYSYLKRQGYLIRDFIHLEDTSQRIRLKNHEKERSFVSLMIPDYFRLKVNSLLSTLKQTWKLFKSLLQKWGVIAYPIDHPLHFSSKHYFSYTGIFESLNLIPTYKKYDSLRADTTDNVSSDDKPSISFNVWKPAPTFSKKAPPTPDFHVCVVKTEQTNFPSLTSIQQLFNEINYLFPFEEPVIKQVKHKAVKKKSTLPPSKKEIRMQRALDRQSKLDSKMQARNTYLKLRDNKYKTGTRNVVIALVNNGVVNFVNLAEGDFSLTLDEELGEIYQRKHGIIYMEKI